MHEILELFKTLTDPDKLRALLTTVLSGWWSYALLFAIVFSETGLLVGFFLPGDSLLFTVGVVAGAGDLNIVGIILLLIVAAIVGNATGYTLGRQAGPRVFSKPDSRLFKREHLLRTQAFYEKHGGKTIIYAQFVPIIRTFAPFVAGVAGMPYMRFAAFNVVGAIIWITLMTLAGFYLGNIPIIRRNFEKAVIAVVLISVLPLIFQFLKSRRERDSLSG
ncbi:MAG: VTT domain-containing protein [Bryobacteraceae bacterium]|nr:VTT domain-containing protein [Bryobacteraceae bacterium]